MLLSEKIANEIKIMIHKGDFKKGERIPNEFILAERLGVSRNTVRDAVKLLVSNNVLRIDRGKGTFVSDTPGISDDPLGLYFVDSEELRSSLEEIRLMFEPVFAYYAAQKATDEEIGTLYKTAEDMASAITKYAECPASKKLSEEILDLDLQFHNLICIACKNPILDNFFPYVTHNLFSIYASSAFLESLTKPKRINTHLKICDAIKARDSETASRLMQQHILNSRFAASHRDKQ